MVDVLGALAPVFAVILLGWACKQRKLVADVFWPWAERLTFYVFFPALLVSNVATAELAGLDLAPMLAATVGGIAVVVALSFVLRRALALGGPAFTSLLQSSVRPNVYVALAAAAALFGDAGLTLVSLCIAVAVPLVNVISVIVLVRYASPGGASLGWRRTAAPVVRNPLIIACVIGIVLNLAGIRLPPLIGPTLEILGRASLPLALLAVGAGIDFTALRGAGPAVAVASVLKLVVLPTLTWGLAILFGAAPPTAAIAVLYAAVPVSATAYVMARQMDGDAPIMAGAITATTLAAMLTLPLALVLL